MLTLYSSWRNVRITNKGSFDWHLPGESERSAGNGYSVNLLRVCGGRKRMGDEYHRVGNDLCNAENIAQFDLLILMAWKPQSVWKVHLISNFKNCSVCLSQESKKNTHFVGVMLHRWWKWLSVKGEYYASVYHLEKNTEQDKNRMIVCDHHKSCGA